MTVMAAPMRARELGIPFSGTPGTLNAITDVPGVEVGYSTLWSGSGILKVGEGPVRTGVTAILPRGRLDARPCLGGSFALNAGGEFTGFTWLEERGIFEGPVLITNTHSLGLVRDAAIQWMRARRWPRLIEYVVPMVGETFDGFFNDIDGGHIESAHVFEALDSARGGPIAEGNVGGGAGMISYAYKGGTGTSSRRLPEKEGGYTVGVLVQSNYGARRHLRIAGIRIGEALTGDMPRYLDPGVLPDDLKRRYASWCTKGVVEGSIIVIVATDAPLLPHQLRRLAKRPALGMARIGGIGTTLSGDLFLAFSTANADLGEVVGEFPAPACIDPYNVRMHPNLALTALFEAAIDATEEAILNALVASDAAEGVNGLYVPCLPHSRVQETLRAHNLLTI
ncbi:DmpA family aminopeptidase [Peristeroidobacter soli]|uniref:DmpA family aminopeptidase n=1 Tax=Peristeroidobacter soli TaxID=2497877 RepID=UPI00101C1518|nr:P1 family peptidase [Peristeroidobacter soli]